MRFYSLDRSMGRRLRPWLAPLALLTSLACASALAHNANNSITTGSHANAKPKTSLKPAPDAARVKLHGPGPEAVKVSMRQPEPRVAPLPQAAVPRPASEDGDGPHGMFLATLVMMAVIAVRRQSARRR